MAGSFQMSGLARVGMPLSVPSPNATQGSLDITTTTEALSAAVLGSNGALPCAMAPTRPSWVAIT